MDSADRKRIKSNINELVKVENLDILFEEVIRRRISFPEMIERIKVGNKDEEDMKIRFFNHVQTRGPSAFGELVQALFATGNKRLALLLDPTATRASRNPSLLERINEELNFGKSLVTEVMPNDFSLTEEIDSGSEFDESKTPLRINVRNAVLYNNGNLARSYPMMSTPRGFALIINIIDFEVNPFEIHRHKKRLGAEKDSVNLKILLEKLGYDVTVETNVYKNDLLKRNGILDKFLSQFTRTSVDSSFVCIMSHGDEDFWIEMSDTPNHQDYSSNKIHLWNDVITRFSNRNCPSLQGKPKVFVVQACRGLKQNIGSKVNRLLEKRTQSDSSVYQLPVSSRRTMPEFNHIMLLNSTIPGFESIRDKYRGSWFIECVCNVFMNHAWHLNLAEMASLVAEELENLETSQGVKQSCEFTTVGTAYNLYFNPGINVELDEDYLQPLS